MIYELCELGTHEGLTLLFGWVARDEGMVRWRYVFYHDFGFTIFGERVSDMRFICRQDDGGGDSFWEDQEIESTWLLKSLHRIIPSQGSRSGHERWDCARIGV